MIDCTIHRTALLPAVKAAIGPVQSKVTIPIIGNLLIAVDGGELAVTGTDLDIIVTARAEVTEAAADGATTVPAKMLADFLGRLPESAEIAMRQEAGFLALSSGRNRIRLQTLPAEDFPVFSPGMERATEMALPGKDLADAIARCTPAISNEESRYYLNGIFMTPRDGEMVFVSTDGHRLREVRLVGTSHGGPEIIVPRETCPLIRKACEDIDAPVTMRFTESAITIETEALTLTSKLVDGTYPQFERIIPAMGETTLIVPREATGAAVAAASVVADAKGAGVKLTPVENGLEITCRNDAVGDAVSGVDAEGDLGFALGVNGRYLADILGTFDGKRVLLHAADNASPILVVPETPRTGWADRGVVMPMRM